MNFKEALRKLKIEKYEKRIFNSNSHGELFHLYQYIRFAENIKDVDYFSKWFDSVVEQAEELWERPESIFQHIERVFTDHFGKKDKFK